LHSLVWTADKDGYGGNFESFQALETWLSNTQNVGPHEVRVRGTFTFDTTTGSTDLSTALANTEIMFVGEGAVFNVTSDNGFEISNNVTFKNITFNYNPSALSYTAGDKINSGNGCIYSANGSDISNVSIDSCVFSSNATTQRPPFICFELDNEDILDGMRIRDCRFADPSGDGYQAAIVLMALNGGVGTEPCVVANTLIENNTCDQKQGIYVVSSDTAAALDSPGMHCAGTRISNNTCGVVGYLVSAARNVSGSFNGSANMAGLSITGNTCLFIGSTTSFGDALLVDSSDVTDYTYVLGGVNIESNFCSWIQAVITDDSVATGQTSGSTKISNNTVTAYAKDYLVDNLWKSDVTDIRHNAIAVYCPHDTAEGLIETNCMVSNNVIDGRVYTTGSYPEYLYECGIYFTCSGVITGNSVNGFIRWAAGSGWGIALPMLVDSDEAQAIVSNNRIHREGRIIEAFVYGSAAVTPVSAIVTDNYFDKTGTGIVSDTTVVSAGDDWVVERNKNQTETCYLSGADGVISNTQDATVIAGGSLVRGTDSTTLIVTMSPSGTVPIGVYLDYTATNTDHFRWLIDLYQLLPEGVEVISASITGESDNVAMDTGIFYLTIYSGATGIPNDDGSPLIDFSATGGPTTTTLSGISGYRNTATNRLKLFFGTSLANGLADASNDAEISFTDFSITYRW
jgi:hypothetical protein